MNAVVIGAYWGDEGKGKIVDLLAADCEWVVRFNGGDNAGHTLVVNDKKVVLHILPSGILQGKNVAIGPDVFFNPDSFFKDLNEVTSKDFKISSRIVIDERTHLIMPYHIALDSSNETDAFSRIGTTKRGIGPASKDKASRTEDLTVYDLISNDFEKKINLVVNSKKSELLGKGIISDEASIPDYSRKIFNQYKKFSDLIKPYLGQVSYELDGAIKKGHSVLLEGAQGSLLDLVHGTRPFVTSSNATSGGAFANIGVAAKNFKVIGVVKAYPTRVGEGIFPTELDNDLGKVIQSDGQEFGATTGRPRRVGMPDFVALKYSTMVNGFDELIITKIDVLGGKKFSAALSYEKDGDRTEKFPFKLEGWKGIYSREYYFDKIDEDAAIEICEKGYESFPEGIKKYLRDMVRFTGVPISMVSLSPKRDITVIKNVLKSTREYLDA